MLSKGNIFLFKKSYDIYLECINELEKELDGFYFSDELKVSAVKDGFLKTFNRNFILLLLGVLLIDSCDIKKVKSYVKLVLLLNEIVPLRRRMINKDERLITFYRREINRSEEPLRVMLLQRIIDKIIVDSTGSDDLSKDIMDMIYKVTLIEERYIEKNFNVYPTTQEIKENLHKKVGGGLFEIFLKVPANDSNLEKLARYSKGLEGIGSALYALEDLCSVENDIKKGNINYVISKLLDEEVPLIRLKEERKVLTEEFIKNYLNEILEELVVGFDILRLTKGSIGRRGVIFLIKYYFMTRGLDKYLRLAS